MPLICAFLAAGGVEMIAIQLELFQLLAERGSINAEINLRADKHIAADTAENIEI